MISKRCKTAAQPQDKIEISSQAKEMQHASDAVTGSRQEKIAQLKAQIENGSYKVDANHIAKNMINFIKSNKKGESPCQRRQLLNN